MRAAPGGGTAGASAELGRLMFGFGRSSVDPRAAARLPSRARRIAICRVVAYKAGTRAASCKECAKRHEMASCFVVMGFGKKTDFETGRTLDLDKSYKNVIKPAVEAAGLTCIRADEIVH